MEMQQNLIKNESDSEGGILQWFSKIQAVIACQKNNIDSED